MMKNGPSWPIRILTASSHQIHWFAAAAGLAASTVCMGFLLNNPLGAPSRAMVMTDNPTAESRIAVLPGLSGTTYRVAQHQAEGDKIVGSNTAATAQPVGWSEFAIPGCLTVTSENGQKLSFRIKGYRASAKADGDAGSPTIDLAVSDCTQSGKAVVKAVFEPDAAETVLKSAATEHHL